MASEPGPVAGPAHPERPHRGQSVTTEVQQDDQTLATLLQELPQEILTVIGTQMASGDLLTARLASKGLRNLMNPAVAQLNVSPYLLVSPPPTPQQQQARQEEGILVGGRRLRARPPPPPSAPADRRRLPPVLSPPADFRRLPEVFPSLRRAAMRVISRTGWKGQGINSEVGRLKQLFEALAVIAAHHAPEMDAAMTAAAAAAVAGGSGSSPGGTGGRQLVHSSYYQQRQPQNKHVPMLPGLHVSMEMDVDIPRSRYKEAYAAAMEMAHTALDCIASLGKHLAGLSLSWYDVRIPMFPEMATCFASLSRLQRLHLAMTPGPVLPVLSVLTSLTCLRIASVGDQMHMVDTGRPRHTEIHAISALTRLQELQLEGWVCEVTLAQALLQLKGLRTLELGAEINANQAVPHQVLSQLSALTAPTSLSPVLADLPPPSSTLPADRNGYTPHGPATAQGASQDGAPYQHQPQQDVHAARSTRGSSSSSHTSTGGAARVYLPALASLWCHPPTWRLTDGSDLVVQPQTVVLHPAPPPPAVSGGGATSPGAGNSGVLSAANTAGALQQGTAVVAGHVQGRGVQGGDSAREGADAGGIVPQEPSTLQGPGVPALLGSPGKGAARRRLLLPCIVTPNLRKLVVETSFDPLDVGPLGALTSLHLRMNVIRPEDVLVVDPVMRGAVANGMTPNLKELQVQLVKGQTTPALLLSSPSMQVALNQAVRQRLLTHLRTFMFTRVWEGLVPEGWDYTRERQMMRFQPSPILPSKHLSFLTGLPSLSTLVLNIDRVRLDLLPPSLTSLTLEGLVRIDAMPPAAAAAARVRAASRGGAAAAAGAGGMRGNSGGGASVPAAAAAGAGGGTPGAVVAAGSSSASLAVPAGGASQPTVGTGGAANATGSPSPPPQQQQQGGSSVTLTQVTQEWGWLTPQLKRLKIMLAKHPRGPPSQQQSHLQQQASHSHLESQQQQQQQGVGTRGRHMRRASSVSSTGALGGGVQGVDGTAVQLAPGAVQSGAVGGMGELLSPFCVLDYLVPLLAPSLTSLSFTATPRPGVSRLDHLSPSDYGLHVLCAPGRLPALRSLEMYVMPKHAWLLDCGQLMGLSSLAALRSLSLESPLTGATRLARLSSLSSLTQVTQLVTGRLDEEAYPGRVYLGGMTPAARASALSWLSLLVAGRFGTLPTGGEEGGGGAESGSDADDGGGGGEDQEEEDGPGALVGSDTEVHSEDLLYSEGEEGDAESEGPTYEEDEEV